jgi:hypothetical protein
MLAKMGGCGKWSWIGGVDLIKNLVLFKFFVRLVG